MPSTPTARCVFECVSRGCIAHVYGEQRKHRVSFFRLCLPFSVTQVLSLTGLACEPQGPALFTLWCWDDMCATKPGFLCVCLCLCVGRESMCVQNGVILINSFKHSTNL